MEHPQLHVLQREKFIWSLSNIPLLEPYLHLMDGDPVQQVVKSVIQLYKTCVQPKLGSFRKCESLPSPAVLSELSLLIDLLQMEENRLEQCGLVHQERHIFCFPLHATINMTFKFNNVTSLL